MLNTEIREKNGVLKKYDIVYLFNFQPPTACMYKLRNEPRNWERTEKNFIKLLKRPCNFPYFFVGADMKYKMFLSLIST